MAETNDFFENYLPNKMKENPDMVSDINATFAFDIDGAGQWTVDLTGTGEVREGLADDAGCKVEAKKEDFESMLENPASAMMLFMSGKLKVTNPGLAMSLQKILS